MAQSVDAQEATHGLLSRAYVEAFQRYVTGGCEADLEQAYEVSRSLLSQGFGVLSMTTLQYGALCQLLEKGSSAAPDNIDFERAKLFFAESLSPYEMAHRSYREAIATLRQMNEMLEREIHRIAHTVHDEAGQLLLGARLAISELGGEVPEARGRLDPIKNILDQVEDQLRRLSHELRPTILDDLGLVPALKLLADGVAHRSGLSIQVRSSLANRCPPKVEIALYRIAQEALNNVSRHARARQVQIELLPVADGIECRIQDDGVGFDMRSIQPGSGTGLGLLGARERLAALGGALAIDSVPGRGTKLLLKVPGNM
jgi:signal transduction histidine kinase